ncbi:hypothetical protein, partial [Acetobacter senegalensis]
FQIKQIAHAVVTDLHTAPIPRSGFVLPPPKSACRLPPIQQTGSAHLKSDEVVSLLLYSS